MKHYDEAFRRVTGRPVGVVPFRALASAEQRTAVVPDAAQAGSRLERVRRTTDMLWRLNEYTFVACACGTALKFPSAYVGREIACPHCGTVHRIQPSVA